MQDHHIFSSQPDRRPGGGFRANRGNLTDLAHWALALLAARRASGPPELRPALLETFREVAIDPDDSQMGAFLSRLVRERVSAAAMADVYIPELARRLGQDWMDDSLSFIQVSLATARMQAMLRAIGCAWSADAAVPGGVRAVVLVVPRSEQHTLGALVLLGQLRRLGVTVRLMLGSRRGEIGAVLRKGGIQGVLISASGSGRLAEVRDIVEEIRKDGPPGIPVVLGGVVLEAGMEGARATGADIVTSDLQLALSACGIEIGTGLAQLRA